MIENDIGFEYQTESYLCFFGKSETKLEDLFTFYKDIEFRNIKQTHSDKLVNSDKQADPLVEADAHWTDKQKLGLLIKTADCLPIMLYDKNKKRAVAIHAGWKGVSLNITGKAIELLKINDCDVIVGPHIRQNSFEVDDSVMKQLIDSERQNDLFVYRNNKYHIHLEKIIQNQINSLAKVNQYVSLEMDTKTDLRFNSYRRNKDCGRNLSFIFLK